MVCPWLGIRIGGGDEVVVADEDGVWPTPPELISRLRSETARASRTPTPWRRPVARRCEPQRLRTLAASPAAMWIPAPVAFGYLVTFAELIGGALLVVGLLTRLARLPLIVILAVATVAVKLEVGLIAGMGAPLPGAELDLTLLAGLVAVLLLGPGRPSLDRVLGIERAVPTAEPAAA